ncbi:MAG: hypothetical protein AAB320_10090 [Elusimicrobiota bacterium]|mgnify:FL=1
MIRRRFLGFFCIVALGLALFDSVADAASCDPQTTACHDCFCAPHLFSPAVIAVEAAPAPASYISYEPSSYAFLHCESLLRPPCLAA